MADVLADWFFAIGSLLWSALLIPILLNRGASVPRWSSVPSFLLLLAYAGMFYRLGMLSAVVSSFFGALLWLFIAQYRYTRAEDRRYVRDLR